MSDVDNSGSTRRQFLTIGAGTASMIGFAGCMGGSDDPSAGTDTPGSTEENVSASAQQSPYAVTMEPMGEVSFESVPETWMAYFSTYGDMGIALGQLDRLEALIYTENWPREFFEYLPDVDVSFDDVRQLYSESSIDKEVFYDVGADVHLMDPNFIARLDDTWKPEDFEEITTNIGPIVGNSIRRRDEDWHDYPYYSLYEAFEKIATVFQEQRRYQALKEVHDTLISDIKTDLPPETERPKIGLLSINSDFETGSFYAYPVHQGNGHKQYRDLGIQGAFEPHIDGSYAEWDYEQLHAVDPDILVFQYGFSHVSKEQFDTRIQMMREDPVGTQLSAVKNDRLYRGGSSYQGPIINLFQTEIAAKQFYPETFGEWHGLDTLSTESERLFDYQHVADIINGEF